MPLLRSLFPRLPSSRGRPRRIDEGSRPHVWMPAAHERKAFLLGGFRDRRGGSASSRAARCVESEGHGGVPASNPAGKPGSAPPRAGGAVRPEIRPKHVGIEAARDVEDERTATRTCPPPLRPLLGRRTTMPAFRILSSASLGAALVTLA